MKRKEYTITRLHRQLTRMGTNHSESEKIINSARAKAIVQGVGIVYVGGEATPNQTLRCELINGECHWYL